MSGATSCPAVRAARPTSGRGAAWFAKTPATHRAGVGGPPRALSRGDRRSSSRRDRRTRRRRTRPGRAPPRRWRPRGGRPRAPRRDSRPHASAARATGRARPAGPSGPPTRSTTGRRHNRAPAHRGRRRRRGRPTPSRESATPPTPAHEPSGRRRGRPGSRRRRHPRTRGCGARTDGSRSRRVDELLARLALLLPLVEEGLASRLGPRTGRPHVGVDLLGERRERVADAVDGLLHLLGSVLPRVAGGVGGLVELGPRLRLALPEGLDRLVVTITSVGSGQVRLDLQLVDLLLELLECFAGLRAVLVLRRHGCSSCCTGVYLLRYAVPATSGTVHAH